MIRSELYTLFVFLSGTVDSISPSQQYCALGSLCPGKAVFVKPKIDKKQKDKKEASKKGRRKKEKKRRLPLILASKKEKKEKKIRRKGEKEKKKKEKKGSEICSNFSKM